MVFGMGLTVFRMDVYTITGKVFEETEVGLDNTSFEGQGLEEGKPERGLVVEKVDFGFH